MNKKAQILREDGIEYVYQPIRFKPEIANEYYVGDCFVGMQLKSESESGELTARIKKAGINGYMVGLVNELTDVIGKENQKYDGYEFGQNLNTLTIEEVLFYFLIEKEKYYPIMEKINNWKKAKGYEKIMYFDIKDVK